MDKYQGEIIDFSINLNDRLVSDFEQIYIYMYTDCCVVKFAYPAKEGYDNLELTTTSKLSGNISSEKTKTMQGTLNCDLFFDGNIKKFNTGIQILKNIIKNEV